MAVAFRVQAAGGEAEPLPALDEGPVAYALRSARAKAACVAAACGGDDFVLGADTVVAIEREILGKPADDAEAARMLVALSGRGHDVTTGFCILQGGRERCTSSVTTRVVFSALTPGRIAAYVASGEGRDKAGAYAIQGAGMALVRSIDGSYSNVVGLPAAEVLEALERVGALR